MNLDTNPINLSKLKQLLHQGIQCIPLDTQTSEAVIVIGDTGVGKSTIMSFLNGDQLIVKMDGLKPVLANSNSKIKIGHQKFSQTSVPTKVLIQNMAFYDCPGFKDNKGQEYEISNSFFVQRLLDLYKKVRIVLVVDQSHISEDRADKLPRLLKNLHKAFETFNDIQEGCCLLINRATQQNSEEDYKTELLSLIQLKNENGHLFQLEQRDFVKYLVRNQRILIFKQPPKQLTGKKFQGKKQMTNILSCIKSISTVKSRHIKNIISENAKLAIRNFIDEITKKSNKKIEIICNILMDIYNERIKSLGKNLNGIMILKEELIKLIEEVKGSDTANIMHIFQRELPHQKLQDFEQDFTSIFFFKEIYDKTDAFFSNLVNKIYSELSHLLTHLDEQITALQKIEEEEKIREMEKLEKAIRQQRHEEERIQAERLCQEIDDIKRKALGQLSSNKSMIDEVAQALKSISSISDQIEGMRRNALSLLEKNKEIEAEYKRSLGQSTEIKIK